MGIFYSPGETKKRPGVYQRFTSRGDQATSSALVGVVAIPVISNWGPLGEVTTNESEVAFTEIYGNGGENSTVDGAVYAFRGGASKVFACRIGTGGSQSSIGIMDTSGAIVGMVQAKYVGSRSFEITIAEDIADPSVKRIAVYENKVKLEEFSFATFASGGVAEIATLAAAAINSNYIEVINLDNGDNTVAEMAQTELTGGADPDTSSVTAYSDAFNKLEAFEWNMITPNSDDVSVHALLLAYMQRIYPLGKFGIAVLGEPVSVDFETRCAHSKAFNSENIVYFGSGWKDIEGNEITGRLAVSHMAGLIASTSTDKGIVRTVINGAINVLENLTNAQLETAIDSGMVMLSLSPDGQVWIDNGVNTLISLDADQDSGWKKIKRVMVRYEAFNRIDQVVSPLVGKVRCDSDGVAAVIVAGKGVLKRMAAEKKILPDTYDMYEDPELPHSGDSAWFIIVYDDIDMLEKIYLHYQFRYSPNV